MGDFRFLGPRLRFLQALVAVLCFLLSPGVKASSTGILGYHGNPSDCTVCHNAGAYTATASITAPTSVGRGLLSGTFTLSGSGGNRRGFNIAVYNPSGVFVNGVYSSLSSGVNANSGELTHNAPQTLGSWTFRWTAPSTLGTYTVYACVNPVNYLSPFDSTGDGDAACDTDTFVVTNTAPVADDESTSVAENSTVIITDATLLTGDTDTNGDSLSVTGFSQPSGLAFVTDNGSSFTYNPNGKYESLDSGEPAVDTFTYTVSDGNLTDTGTVSVTVNGANDPPVAVADTISVGIDGAATVLVGGATSVLTNDTDPDSTEAIKQSFEVAGVTYGTLSLATDGTFTYTHNGTNNLFDSFTYRVWDGTIYSSNATVNINIANTEPTAVNDPLVATILEEGTSSAINVIGNDTDPETSVIAVGSITGQTNGTAVVQGDQTVIFTHDGSETTSASFQYTASDGFLTSLSSATVTLTITPVNDPPVLAAISTQTATENALFSFDVGAFLTDPDDANNGADITWSIQSGLQSGMTISNVGVINWTLPQTGIFNQSYGPLTIRAVDGEPLSDTVSFSLSVSPPDGDFDNVADYDDLCLTIADSTNADNDGDGTPGSDGGINDGGDACDLDDDNDGMPDTFEITYGLDQFDAADATGDADGDGISNLAEFSAGTNPLIADLVIDATGYLTPVELTPPSPTSVDASAFRVEASSIDLNGTTLAGFDPLGPYRPGKNEIIWTGYDIDNISVATSIQTLTIRPIFSFSVDQFTQEGDTVTVSASLNGQAATYPVIVNYSISGTAGASDHNATNSSFTFSNPDQVSSITFNVANDATAEADETVFFTANSATNAVIGSRNRHLVTITEGNVMPSVEILVSQGGLSVASAYASEGPVTVDVIISDVNTSQSHSIDWTNTDNSLSAPTDNTTTGWSFSPAAGIFLLEVNVTDDGSPALSNRISRVLNIASTAPILTAVDTDGDGINDDVEGLGDTDTDGIPDYLDAYDGTAGESNLLTNQTVDLTTQFLIETEPGLTLTLGNTSMAANNFGIMVTDADIETFGSESGNAPLSPDDDFNHVGGTYDFEIKGLLPGSEASIVLPLQTPIPNDAEYRKFNPTTGWGIFIEDIANQVASAPGVLGACPEPGSNLYQAGLSYLDNCLQLTIEDGGPNDIDATANGIIKDPGSVGLQLTDAVTPIVRGGGQVHPWLLVWLLGLAGLLVTAQRKRKNKF